MELEANHCNLRLQGIEDEEMAAAEESLRSRQSRQRQNNVSTVVISGNEIGNENGNGNVVVPVSTIDLETANGTECESLSNGSEEASRKLQNNSVYFDQNNGTESVYGISEVKNGSVASPTFKKNFKDADANINLDVQKSLIEETNDQCGENLEDKENFDSSLTPLEESHEEQNKRKPFDSETRLIGDSDLTKEIEQEETEFDVERVIEKQNTHDLYCPNCNSCITRKVILRRRKRKVLNLQRKPKYNKVENISGTESELDANSTNSANVQVHDSGNAYLSGSPQAMTNNDDREREPEVFRCLSCFSFFIPTGQGFKLFSFSGDGPENESVQNLRTKPATNANWFFSIFTAGKRKTNSEQVGSETLADQNRLDSAITPLPITPVNHVASVSEEARKDIAGSSTGDNNHLENTSTSVGDKSYNASEQANTDNVLFKKGHPEAPLPGVRVNTGKLAADASQGPPQGGVNSQVSSTYKSLIPESQYLYQNYEIAVAEEQPIQNDQTLSVRGTPLPPLSFNEGEPDPVVAQHETIKDTMFSSSQGTPIIEKLKIGAGEQAVDVVQKSTGSDVIVYVGTRPLEPAASQGVQNIDESTGARTLLQSETQTYMREQRGAGVTVDILKSIVYGGLIESITSLGVVSSAAGAGSATLNILALGLANVIGGLFIIGHNLIELKNDTSNGSSNQINERKDRYLETLGRRDNFLLHATVAIISFLIFGMLPPVLYGFSYRKSDNKDLKLAVVGGASLLCIILLSIGKAHVQRQPRSYISTVLYHVSIGVMASGASYIAGDLIGKLLEKIGWSGINLSVTMVTGPVTRPIEQTWASY